MITKTEKIRLGIFLVVAIAVVVAVFIALAGIKLMEKYDIYHAYFDETVSGLEIGAQIKYNGVRVGKVKEIRIDPQTLDRVIVTLELNQGTPIKKDTQAVLRGMGITGLKFVELTGGSVDQAFVPPGGTIKAGRSLMGTIEGKAEDIALKTELAIDKINAVLSDQNIAAFSDVLTSVKELAVNTNRLVGQNDEKINAIVDSLSLSSNELAKSVASAKRSAQRIESIVATSSPKVEGIIDDAQKTAAIFKNTMQDLVKVGGTLDKLEKTLTKVDNQIDKMALDKLAKSAQNTMEEADKTVKSIRRIVESSRENIYRASTSLKNSLKNFEQISTELRDQPSLLLNAKPPKDRTPSE